VLTFPYQTSFTLDVSYAVNGFPGLFCDSPPLGTCYLGAFTQEGLVASVPLTFEDGPPIQPPEASFTLDLLNGLTVQADASASSDPNGGPGELQYVWDWGDGSDASQDYNVVNPTHAYTALGTYEIMLGVINEWGLFDVATQTVTMGAAGGETVTTDPDGSGATSELPIQTSLELPASLVSTNVAISTRPASGSTSGFAFFDTEVVVDVGGATASSEDPFVITFTVDATKLDGVAPADVQIFRDGVLVGDCTDVSAAVPDPCVASREARADGDGAFVVRTSHFSTFSFARFAWEFSGFYSPVDSLPTVNTVNAGRAIPVKFSLGANRGLDIFADGYPRSQPYTCETGQPLDQIEETVSANGSGLTYEPATNRYNYVWKTTGSWSGCRELTLRFRDGTEARARFKFK
jgi:hypothetical protein